MCENDEYLLWERRKRIGGSTQNLWMYTPEDIFLIPFAIRATH